MSTTTVVSPKRLVHPVDEVLPPQKLAAYGIQHVLAFYAGAVIVPILLASAIGLTEEQLIHLINADLLTCGIASLLQTVGIWKIGVRLPLLQGVTFVIRGDDLLSSTARQIHLARLLGRTAPPRFLHHALVMKSPFQKLSKADGDTSVRDLRARGLAAGQVIGRAASLVGLVPPSDDLRADDLPALAPLVALAERVRRG